MDLRESILKKNALGKRTLGNVIRARREKAGLSQVKLAGLIGAKAETISHIEIGRKVPIEETIWAIGAALCFDLSGIKNLLELAKHHRKHRPELKEQYGLNYLLRVLGNKSFEDRK